MAIQLLQEKAILQAVQHFAHGLSHLMPGSTGARKRHKLLKALVSSINAGIDYLQAMRNTSQYNDLLHHFTRHFFPSQKKLIKLIGYGVDQPSLEKTFKGFQEFVNQELSGKPNALELYNALALALQIEVVRVSRELKNDSSDPNFILQGQQVDTDTNDTETEEDKRYLEEALQPVLETLDLNKENIRKFTEVIGHLSAGQLSAQQSKPQKSNNVPDLPSAPKQAETKTPPTTPKTPQTTSKTPSATPKTPPQSNQPKDRQR